MEKKDFRIVFMGTPDFAVESLKSLVENSFNIVTVVTSPDKPSGRGQKINQSAVKKYAVEQNLPILQPTNLKDPSFQQELNNLKADLNIIVAFRMLPESVWSMPRLGSINLHGSLLPQYRGAAPINWAIINGEQKTGVTTFFLKHEIDTGDILFNAELQIEPNDNAGIIHDKLMLIGAQLIVKTTNKIIEGNYNEIPQEQLTKEELKHAPKIFKPDCRIDWNKNNSEIHNLIRGLSPYPAAWTQLITPENKTIDFKIFKTVKEEFIQKIKPGTVLTDGKTFLKVASSNGLISILELQLAGKKRMQTSDLLRGYKINQSFIIE